MTRTELEKLIGHKRSHKYGAKATVCNLGHKHPSRAEEMHCRVLQTQMKAGLVRDLQYEKSYELKIAGKLIAVHRPDFTYIAKKRKVAVDYNADGEVKINQSNDFARIGLRAELADYVCVDEVKGFKTADWILKSKMFQAIYPEIHYRVVML